MGTMIPSEPAHSSQSRLGRYMGGAPTAVVVRLAVLSLVVGAMMVWLDIDPLVLVDGVQRLVLHVWNMGFGAVHDVGRYMAAGALVVVPIWLLARVFAAGGGRR
ncbi:DUF6460 domain-containing protein [Lichenihabitans sp. Uapishka_5]|uniref:DUF6460 domain-containing protein n=1 Tax=Lichenihabitans sp. Uapishka_5 TaxID=3037302 RepID=UPI0029E7E6A3|nr:DUF6460 domain-containing protein [Lichenihabitans sp. Uapishka_5]MDX7953634.1 DUF6460 domain-containing protein [Lichenihabitans sp. Uapishka_5]